MSVPEDDRTAALQELRAEVERLVAALDRRVPRPERASEEAIASDARALRARALELISKLESGPVERA